MTCSPPGPADTRLRGELVSSDRFWGDKKIGVPVEVLANSRLPSREVMPLEARAVEREGGGCYWSKNYYHSLTLVFFVSVKTKHPKTI